MANPAPSELPASQNGSVELTPTDREIASIRSTNVAAWVHDAMVDDVLTKKNAPIDAIAFNLDNSAGFDSKRDLAIQMHSWHQFWKVEDGFDMSTKNSFQTDPDNLNPDHSGLINAQYLESDPARKEAVKDAVLQSPQVKSVLPEVALLELQADFPSIHDMDKRGGITGSELANCMSRHSGGNELAQLALDYAARNFSAFKSLDPSAGNEITWKGIQAGLKDLGQLETERAALELAPKTADALTYLDQHFSDIHKTDEFPGISQHEFGQLSAQSSVGSAKVARGLSIIGNHFKDITNLNTADGGGLWFTGGLMSGNANGITRQDLAIGLQQAKDNPTLISQLQAKLDNWPK